jgi:mannose-1-phosphate guanylyltransferase
MGVKPTYPSAKYGYILPAVASDDTKNDDTKNDDTKNDDTKNDWIAIKGFVEKPEEAEARRLIQDGALWNCGVFAFKLKYMLDKIQEAISVKTFETLREHYGELTRNSFDYVVSEKETSIAMVKYEGYWKDLGTWNTFTDHMGEKVLGKAFVDETCENTHVVNELDIPVIVMGTKDLVVAVSYDGILITDKEQSANIKPHVERIQQRPMYEERRWGEYRVVDYAVYPDGTKALTKRLLISAGKSISYQIHHHRSETWIIVHGEGELLLDDQRQTVRQGDVLQIPLGMKHAIRGVSDLEIIEIQLGAELEESDVIRLSMEW